MIERGTYRFDGLDGSLGYRAGREYALTIRRPSTFPGADLDIIAGGSPCPYTEAGFRRNWSRGVSRVVVNVVMDIEPYQAQIAAAVAAAARRHRRALA